MNKTKLFFHKVSNWEYWPYQIVYFPIYFQYLYYVVRTKSFFYFSASNPTMKNGGFFMESKKEIYDLIPQQYYPATILINPTADIKLVREECNNKNIRFPLIAKPDIGLRGTAVKKLNNEQELSQYHKKANFNYIIQNVIPYKKEIGLFYVKYPNQIKGTITGIVEKEFLIVKGNGENTIEELLQKNPRFAFQIPALKQELKEKLQNILEKDEALNLVPYGNHCRGSKFIDASDKITPQLIESFDKICNQIDGFYFGRLDIMFNNYEELAEAKNFEIIEINGAASEPTHIYDPKHSLLFGWKELTRHFHYLYLISKLNNKINNEKYLTFKEGVSQFKQHKKYYSHILKF